jgi:hypothetical protein
VLRFAKATAKSATTEIVAYFLMLEEVIFKSFK